jgi:diguanylate cyclase (GGDEF)-like protein
MSSRVNDLPKSAWRRVVFWTALITAICVVISVAISCVLLNVISQGINGPGIVTAIVMPIIMGTPIMFYMQLRHQQLKFANARLDILASTDSLTDCLNRRAFTAGAASLLAVPANRAGALLVIDADHFKLVNDRFGHEAGDRALQKLATTLQAAVRQGDLVGRLGGEEFAVFLRDADYDTARIAAERIRDAVAAIDFAPDGVTCPISVSIGGATTIGDNKFAELFRAADEQLYGAKSAGRNRIELVRMPPSIATPANGNLQAATAIDKTLKISL